MNREDYNKLLLAAIGRGDVAAVESCLQTFDIDVDFIFDIGGKYVYELSTPLHLAIRCNHKTIVEVLLAHGAHQHASVNGPVDACKTPLQEACDKDSVNEEIVNLLIVNGADVDAMTARERRTPLTLASHSTRNLGIAQLLLDAGADVNGSGVVVAPLHWAALGGNIEAIELLIQAGADVNRASTEEDIGGPEGSTPLHFAAFENELTCLNTLLKAGANPNIGDARRQTPLYPAACYASVDVINALLAAGCDPLHRNNRGRTPLQHLYAAFNRFFSAKHFNIITALVAAGDCSWECVPTPCPGLEAAMLSVWQAAPDELPELVKRMENPPQTLIELYAHMDDDDDDDDDDEEMKKVVQEVLRVLHHHFAGFPHLKQHLLTAIFGFRTSV